MATFEQNIRNIRGEATYGKDMRTSIADAIEQSVHLTYQDIAVPYPSTDEIHIQVAPVIVGTGDYVLGISKTTD